eukprot:COSAG06_NODE_51981_length_308_cov_1.722488_1_plen_73_part_10
MVALILTQHSTRHASRHSTLVCIALKLNRLRSNHLRAFLDFLPEPPDGGARFCCCCGFCFCFFGCGGGGGGSS